MMWVSNNKQYLFDDPSQSYKIIQIVGKAQIKGQLEQTGLSDMEIKRSNTKQLQIPFRKIPDSVTPQMLDLLCKDVQKCLKMLLLQTQSHLNLNQNWIKAKQEQRHCILRIRPRGLWRLYS